MKKAICIILLIITFIASFFMREYNIINRVSHADEAEQAATFSKLAKSGKYEYNPNGPHGPTLYYYAYAWYQNPMLKSFDMAREANVLSDTPTQYKTDLITIPALRKSLAPWLFFIFLCYVMAAPLSGRATAWAACGCFALSGLSCIYSGYFVHEIIFAAAVFALAQSFWMLLKSPSPKWALATGALAGFAQSTKETSIIAFFAIAISACCAMFAFPKLRKSATQIGVKKISTLSILAILSFAAIFCAFYSSFGTNLEGIVDAFRSYSHFLDKSTNQNFHEPFWYYLQILGIGKYEGAIFGELPISILFCIGFARAIYSLGKHNGCEARAAYILYCSLCAIVSIFVLSMLTYKTPWLLLSPMVFICVVAGYAVAWILKSKKFYIWIPALICLCALGFWQYRLCASATIRYAQDPRNPLIFSHTVRDYANLLSRITDAEKSSNFKSEIPIAFIMGTDSPWPAPWHLRNYPNIGYWGAHPPENLSDFEVIICSPSMEESVAKLIDTSKYESEFFGLRKNLVLTVYIKKWLFKKIVQ